MISFIVPVYNAEKTIERCVASILRQQCAQKEIILVNDGSRDGTPGILRTLEAQHSEIIVIDKPNGGVSSARNAGLEICKGEYVTFVDSDDYYLTDHYAANMVKLLEENEQADLVISGYTVLTGDRKTPVAAHKHTEDIYTVAAEFWKYRHVGVMNAPWNKMYKTALIREKFPEQMTMGEDAVFVLQYLQNCRQVVFDDDCGYGYIYELSSSTADYRKKSAYDLKQTGIYYEAIHTLWKCFLPEDLIAHRYIQMKTDEVYLMMRSLLFKKGLAEYMRRDITDVISDAHFQTYYAQVCDRLDRESHQSLTKAIAASAAMQVKLCCLHYVTEGIIRAHLRKK